MLTTTFSLSLSQEINGKQCTIGWYVDDNKISHHEEAVCTQIADAIDSRFHGDLVRTTGKKHIFLGIDFEFIDNGKIAITTPQHLEEVMEAFPETLKGNVINPANSKMFEIVGDVKELNA